MSSHGISSIPLSANEFLPESQQTAGQSAWYHARFAQSGYANAMRGNWACCETPDLGGIIASNGSGWSTSGPCYPSTRSRVSRSYSSSPVRVSLRSWPT
jgi:hypothetical protein